ncbi:hypothetical protein GQ55_7G277300 [Panicum hallii var. hallii]|uniref:Uncharacterized protein n=1 Tax=Panicum hallii var. hallii TaxID=1504633 RepID=A0A2T7CZR4_9POAL|nr:hypothetical protein GQ55_7G277300 [Panicum hallii var. hallii]
MASESRRRRGRPAAERGGTAAERCRGTRWRGAGPRGALSPFRGALFSFLSLFLSSFLLVQNRPSRADSVPRPNSPQSLHQVQITSTPTSLTLCATLQEPPRRRPWPTGPDPRAAIAAACPRFSPSPVTTRPWTSPANLGIPRPPDDVALLVPLRSTSFHARPWRRRRRYAAPRAALCRVTACRGSARPRWQRFLPAPPLAGLAGGGSRSPRRRS